MATVVAGVDGSVGSREALKWAARECRTRRARLIAVYAYPPPDESIEGSRALAVPATLAQPVSSAADPETRQRRAEEARQRADDLVKEMLTDVGARGIDVERKPIPDRRPAQVLIDHSRNADLLVVGSRGLGGFKGLLLGSVAQHCIRWASCPVLVVREGVRVDG